MIYEKRGEEEEAEEKGGQGPAKKPRYDAAEHRPARVKGSVAEAVRRGGGGPSRPPFKQPTGWRGAALEESASREAAEAPDSRATRPDPELVSLEGAPGGPTGDGGALSDGLPDLTVL